MNSSLAQRQQVVEEQLAEARDRLAASQRQLGEVDNELGSLSGQRQRYELLGQIYDALGQLDELGESKLFWGDDTGTFQPEQRMAVVRASVNEYREEMGRFEERRQALRAEIETHEQHVDDLTDALEEIKEVALKAQEDFVIEREVRELPYRPMVMPWNRQGEDQRRFRKVLLLTMLAMFMVGGLTLFWEVPPPDKTKPVVVPERLAKMVKKKAPPKPPEPVKEVKKDEPKKDEPKKDEPKKDKPKPTEAEKQQARAKAETKGVLAFKNSFADLMEDSSATQLGADARITNAGSQAVGGAPGQRSLIVAQAGGGSGGIANSAISRGGVGNGSGGAITGSGVAVSRAKSDISEMQGDDRPLTKGAGPSRTDEEIQIVFDKYKSALYRIYNRELRNDPTLRGKMVLALTIEPDGRVSVCKVQSTDMNSPTLSADIVARVLKFNFGAKEGVPATKILYPIDFLPAG